MVHTTATVAKMVDMVTPKSWLSSTDLAPVKGLWSTVFSILDILKVCNHSFKVFDNLAPLFPDIANCHTFFVLSRFQHFSQLINSVLDVHSVLPREVVSLS
ncbi:MAG: hypothetical protein [Caudoviricetes sp.]|nr:MAG: hypothetical protein [Caudoviricetes sp.]